MVANRDQVVDLMRNAETSEAYAKARETVQHLREETDARVRELLNDAQYEAYEQTLGGDDDRRPPFVRAVR